MSKQVYTECDLCGILLPGVEHERPCAINIPDYPAMNLEFVCANCAAQLSKAVKGVVDTNLAQWKTCTRKDDILL